MGWSKQWFLIELRAASEFGWLYWVGCVGMIGIVVCVRACVCVCVCVWADRVCDRLVCVLVCLYASLVVTTVCVEIGWLCCAVCIGLLVLD